MADNEQQEMIEVGVGGGVTIGSHLPYSSISIGDKTVNLPPDHGLNVGITLVRSSISAYYDHAFYSYLTVVMALDTIAAWQHLTAFQMYRARLAGIEAETQRATAQGGNRAARRAAMQSDGTEGVEA